MVRRDEDPVELAIRAGGSTARSFPAPAGPFRSHVGVIRRRKAVAPAAADRAETRPDRDHPIRPEHGQLRPSASPQTRAPRRLARRSAGCRQARARRSPSRRKPRSRWRSVGAAAPAPPRAPSPRPPGGGYVVQLSAQKSEAEAQAAFRAMQAKYAALGGQQPLIRRKDQGERASSMPPRSARSAPRMKPRSCAKTSSRPAETASS